MVELCRNLRAVNNFNSNRRAERDSIRKLQFYYDGPVTKPTSKRAPKEPTVQKVAPPTLSRRDTYVSRLVNERMAYQDQLVMNKLRQEKLTPVLREYGQKRGLLRSA